MSSVKKLTIATATLGVVLLAAIIAVIAVFAAGNQAVGSNFTVSYKATNVAATVSAGYAKGAATSYTAIGEAVTFNAEDATNDAQTGKSLSTADDLSLDLTNKYITFKYTFKNNSTSVAFKVSLADGSAQNNVEVSYGTSTDALSATLPTDVTVAAEDTVDIYVRVAIDDVNSAASYTSAAGAGLVWTLTAA